MKRLLFYFFTCLALWPAPAHALSSPWYHDSMVDVRLISALEGVGQKIIIPLGLEVRMEPGWHTYWRSPGAAGMPPQFDWSKSNSNAGNLMQATVFYPAPKRYIDHDIETIGYQSRVIFPIDAELRHIGTALNIDATVNLLVCSTLCVPKTFHITMKVPADAAIEGPETDVLRPFRDQVPGSDEARAGLAIDYIVNDGKSLTFSVSSQQPLDNPDIFVESQPEIGFLAPKIKFSSDRRKVEFTVSPEDPSHNLEKLGDTPLVVTVVDEHHALEMPMTLPPVGGYGEHPLLSLRWALLLAIAGGFILNLMPCVLPVLSLKIFSFVGHGGSSAAAIRRSFATTAAGILFSFLMLAAVTLVFKNMGHVLGWGMQFQQPLFLTALILVLVVFAANMWGLYSIGLPRFVANRLADHHHRLVGDFASGVLATLLATPCSAPFLGTAIGFALASGSAHEIIAIFTALGFGMMLPYLAIAAVPELAALLPKPGAWTKILRVLLGFALAATAAWLLLVLASQIKSRYALTVGACGVGIIGLFIARSSKIARFASLLGIFLFAGVAFFVAFMGAPAQAPSGGLDAHWQHFDPVAISKDVEAGHVVFVDITADWCLTCKANRKFVLSDQDISDKLFHGSIIAMEGDWTNPDPAITEYLHQFRRYGIPFNVVYGPGAPYGITLPELLNHDSVMDALNRASKPM